MAQGRRLAVLALAGLVPALALGFPARPFVADALTGAPAADFTVAISPWRLAFEPFLGPLLFGLRSPRPLADALALAAWVAVALWLVPASPRRGAPARPPRLRTWLLRLPVAAAVLGALAAALYFLPLPGNSIERRAPGRVLVDVHAHSSASHDGRAPVSEQMRWHARNGFDAFFLTEHGWNASTLQAVARQDRGELPATPVLLPGQEVSAGDHVLLLGVDRGFPTRGLAPQAWIDRVHAAGGVAVVAHWFRDRKRPLAFYTGLGVDGFEIENQNIPFYAPADRRALVDAARAHDLLLLAGCDYHGYGPAARAWNALSIDDWESRDLAARRDAVMQVLRERAAARVQVLVYRDRGPVPSRAEARALAIALAPGLAAVGYLRSLDPAQVASWLAWLAIGAAARRSAFAARSRRWRRERPGRTGAALAAAAGAILLAIGALELSRAATTPARTSVHLEYGGAIAIAGALALGYALALPRVLGGRLTRAARTRP